MCELLQNISCKQVELIQTLFAGDYGKSNYKDDTYLLISRAIRKNDVYGKVL